MGVIYTGRTAYHGVTKPPMRIDTDRQSLNSIITTPLSWATLKISIATARPRRSTGKKAGLVDNS